MSRSPIHPDLILLGADIVTMDPLLPRAGAMAIAGGRVVALGSEAEMRALAGPRSAVMDAGGRLVLPGFQDTHIHLQDSGQDYSQNADLTDCRTPDEIVATLSAFAATHDRPWVCGTGWYSGVFGPHNLDAALLDRAVPGRPCMVVASDGHNGCINSAAIAATGLTDATPDPLNGHFVRDGAGHANGHLYETAVMWVEARMPRPADDDFAAGVLWAQALAHRHGITGVLDAKVEERHVRVYRRLAAETRLTLRVAATALVTPEDSPAQAVERLTEFRRGTPDGMFKVHSAKFFLDGVLENRTGAMIAPYSDQGDNAPLMFTPDQIATLFPALDAARFQIHVHAIGDMATRAALDGMALARAANGTWPSLHQIAHVQCLDPADAPRFRELGVMANIQPLWARHEPSVTDVALPMVGPERGRWMYAFRTLRDAGATLALSSDWGVSTLNPFEIIETAVTRQPPRRDGSHPIFLPEQRLTVQECVAGYTVNAAAAAWRPDTGSLAPGQWADFIVLDRNILACDPRDIGDTQVVMTAVAGVPVHGGL
ncbi:MAG: amidohydrolase [Paracoccaceae bacterium]|nr:MAG: amidohydrolase [Paracoccaceae bacterium]